jgi:Neurotransmitter-gated ion-channel ligand binding domain
LTDLVVHLFRAHGEKERVGGSADERGSKLVSVRNNGQCDWRTTDVITTHCTINVEFFPFDYQICRLVYRGFLPPEDVKLSLTGVSETDDIRSDDGYNSDGQWVLRGILLWQRFFLFFAQSVRS